MIELPVVFGFIAALFVGVSLGLMGGGGSILTVPILVYLFNVSPVLATAYSLFIVGSSSLIGSYRYYKKNLISFPSAVAFGIPSIISVFLTRKLIVPAIPEEVFQVGEVMIQKDLLVMFVFSVVMLIASVKMIKGRGQLENLEEGGPINYLPIALRGLFVGVIAGFVGAGGGFLIIPALVFMAKLPMKKAVGTSLLIISVQSLIGFSGDLGHAAIDWSFLLVFSSIAVGGIFLGGMLSLKIPGAKLKPIFGWFVLLMGVYILGRSFY